MKKICHLPFAICHLPKGFTLVELLISMGLLMIILSILTTLFVTVIDAQLESKALSGVEQDGRFILQRLSYDIHRATSITTPASPGGQGSMLQLVISGASYKYALNGNILEATDNIGAERLNSPQTLVSNVAFTRFGNTLSGKNSIRIQFTLTSVVVEPNTQTRTYQTTVGIR